MNTQNFGKHGAPARILKIFEDASGPEDEEEARRDDLRATGERAPQLVLQWYQRPGQELLEDWPVQRNDELVWLHPEPNTPGVSWDTQVRHTSSLPIHASETEEKLSRHSAVKALGNRLQSFFFSERLQAHWSLDYLDPTVPIPI